MKKTKQENLTCQEPYFKVICKNQGSDCIRHPNIILGMNGTSKSYGSENVTACCYSDRQPTLSKNVPACAPGMKMC